MCLLRFDALQPFLSLQWSRVLCFFFFVRRTLICLWQQKEKSPSGGSACVVLQNLKFFYWTCGGGVWDCSTVRRSSRKSWSVTEYFPSQHGKCRKWAADKILPPSCICSGPLWGAVPLAKMQTVFCTSYQSKCYYSSPKEVWSATRQWCVGPKVLPGPVWLSACEPTEFLRGSLLLRPVNILN